MAWAWVYLAVSVVGALLVVNAFRPARHQLAAGAELLRRLVHRRDARLAHRLAGGRHGGLRPRRCARVLAGLGRPSAVNAAAWTGLAVHARVSTGARHVFARAEEEMPVARRRTWWTSPSHGGRHHVALPPPGLPAAAPGPLGQVPSATSTTPATASAAHRLDVIRRRGAPPAGAPVLVYIHGGAWVIGDKREQGLPLLHELARRGWVTVTINYRLSPRATWPDHIVDCKRALVWVREHIAEYGGDPGFIAVSGGSAGGHLAALLALTPGDPAFQPGFEDGRRVGRRLRAVLRRVRHDGGAGDLRLRRRPADPARAARVQAPARRRSRACSRPPRRCTGSTPTHRRSSSSTGRTTPSSRWPTARAFVAGAAGRVEVRSCCTPSFPTPSTPSTCSRRCAAPTPWPPWCGSWRGSGSAAPSGRRLDAAARDRRAPTAS